MRSEGIFISEHQGTYKWIEGKVDYIFQRVSIGLDKDTKYNEFLPEVKKTECRAGVHYFLTEVDPIEQADFFFRAQGGQGFKALVINYEGRHNVLDAQGEENLWLFYQHLKTLTAKKLLLYCTEYILRDCLLIYNNRWLEVPLWVARYPGNIDPQTFEPLFLDLGNDWAFWQWEADGNGKGAEYGVGSDDVCLDVFNGTVAELDDWLGIIDPPPSDCDELVSEAVKSVTAEFTEQVAVLERQHEEKLLELVYAHKAVLEETKIKAHNDALKSLIQPLLMQ